MRIAGYNLLVFGFLWLTVWCAPSVGPLTHSIAVENIQKYAEGRPYSSEQVRDAIRSVLTEYQENARGVVLPATLMLVGGYLLGRAGARDKNEPDD
jgi:hypothetical protein